MITSTLYLFNLGQLSRPPNRLQYGPSLRTPEGGVGTLQELPQGESKEATGTSQQHCVRFFTTDSEI